MAVLWIFKRFFHVVMQKWVWNFRWFLVFGAAHQKKQKNGSRLADVLFCYLLLLIGSQCICWYLDYLRWILSFPHCTDGVKIGMLKVDSCIPNFAPVSVGVSPNQCRAVVWCTKAQNVAKFLNISTVQGSVTCRIATKYLGFVAFYVQLLIQISVISQEILELWEFNLRIAFSHILSASPSCKTIVRCQNVLEVQQQ